MALLLQLSKGVTKYTSSASQIITTKSSSNLQQIPILHQRLLHANTPSATSRLLRDESCQQHNRSLVPDAAIKICPIQHVQKRYAGHSHWQNTRHIKGANDELKSRIVGQIVKKLKLAIADGGSNDPKLNSALARVVEQAKGADVTKATIERALKKANEKEAPIHTVELRGPASSFLIMKIQTASLHRAKQLVQKEIKKFGGNVGEQGTAKHAFDHVGIVRVELDPSDPVDEDKATDIAIEVGAEDVKCIAEDPNEEGSNILEFVCDPRDVHTVRRSLNKLEYNVIYADDRYVPTTTVKLDADARAYVEKAYNKLELNVEGIVEMYDNIVEDA